MSLTVALFSLLGWLFPGDCLHHIESPVIVPEWTNSTRSLPCALLLTPTTFLVSRDQQQLRCSDITFPFASSFKASGLSLDRLPWELSSTLRPNLPFFYFIVLVKGRCRGPNGSAWLICCQARQPELKAWNPYDRRRELLQKIAL